MEPLDSGAFGNTMASHFHLSDVPAIVCDVKDSPFAATRMTYPYENLGLTSPIADSAQPELVAGLALLEERHDPLCTLALGFVEIDPC
jgi:hypothetical protein